MSRYEDSDGEMRWEVVAQPPSSMKEKSQKWGAKLAASSYFPKKSILEHTPPELNLQSVSFATEKL